MLAGTVDDKLIAVGVFAVMQRRPANVMMTIAPTAVEELVSIGLSLSLRYEPKSYKVIQRNLRECL